MKKIYYFLIPAALMLWSCSDNEPKNDNDDDKPGTEQPTPDDPTPDEPSTGNATLAFGYCSDFYTAVGGENLVGSVLEAAIEIPAEQAAKWIGNEITGMRIGFGTSTSKEVMVYVTEDLSGEPMFLQTAKMTQDMGWNQVTFDEPYTVTGKPFFVGYMVKIDNGNDYPVGIDYTIPENEYGDWMGLNNEWEHIGEFYGSVCVQALVSGPDLPSYSAAVLDAFIPPFVTTGNPFLAAVQITNNGTKTITSITVSVKVNGLEVASPTVKTEEPLASGDFAWVDLPDLTFDQQGANLPMTFAVTQVNSSSNESAVETEITGYLNSSDKGFRRNVVVEEFTGTWCGFCPRGIVGMKYMEENYAEEGFIGVAVHYNDAMQSNSYVTIANDFSNGSYPSAVVDRTYYFDPSAETMEEYFLYEQQYPSYAGLDVEATYNASTGKVKVKGTAEFALNLNNSNYRLAFALKENNVGPYTQLNYFNDGSYGPLEGWVGAGGRVSTIFNEVGREINSAYGISGSVPASISAGSEYSYEAELDASDYDIKQCAVIGLLLNAEDYSVVNGAQVALDNDEFVNIGKEDYTATKATRSIGIQKFSGKSVKQIDADNNKRHSKISLLQK